MAPKEIDSPGAEGHFLPGGTGTTHQKHWTHCNKGHFTCCYGGDDTQKESLCFFGAGAAYTNPAAFLHRRGMKSGEGVEVRIEGLGKGIERQVWMRGLRGQRGKVSAA